MFTDIELVALVTADADRAAVFVERALGALRVRKRRIAGTPRTFVANSAMPRAPPPTPHMHRNTLLRRLARADELYPRALAGSSVNVHIALDVLRWRGGQPG